MAALKADIARVNKLREGLQRRLRAVEDQKHDVESTRDSLKQQITGLDKGERSENLTHAILSCSILTCMCIMLGAFGTWKFAQVLNCAVHLKNS